MKKFSIIFFLFCLILPLAPADGGREIPLDLHLIVDNSIAFGYIRNDAIPWILENLIDSLLIEGDSITLWSAADRASVVASGSLNPASGGASFIDKEAIRSALLNLEASGRNADFTNALLESSQRLMQNQTGQNRLSLTVLVVASAMSIEPVIRLNPHLLRWSRTLHYEGWQVLIVDPHIGSRVLSASQAYMNSLQ